MRILTRLPGSRAMKSTTARCVTAFVSAAVVIASMGCSRPSHVAEGAVRLTNRGDLVQYLGRDVVVEGVAGKTKLGADLRTSFHAFYLPEFTWPESTLGTRVDVQGVLGIVRTMEEPNEMGPVASLPPNQEFYTITVREWHSAD